VLPRQQCDVLGQPEDDNGEVATGEHDVLEALRVRRGPGAEVGLLLLAARARLDAPVERELVARARDPVDWGVLVDLATREGIAPLLHSHLSRLDLIRNLPPDPRDRLTDVARSVWATNALLANHWGEATAALRAAGVETITLKGMALAHTVYPEPGCRPMADVDLLVRPADRAAALDTLRALGYRTPGDAADRHAAFRSFAELVRDGTRIDLHWHLAHYLRFDGVVVVDHDGLWRRARPLLTPAGTSLELCPEDLLLHLTVHLTLGSDFARVLWYADIDAVTRYFAARLDWERLIAEARHWRIRALAGWAFGVVRRSFGTPVPPDVLQRLGQGHLRRAAVAHCIGSSMPPSLCAGLADARVYPAQTLLMDRAIDMLRVLGWTFFPSTAWLRSHYELQTPWQIPVYRAAHPLRVCWLAARQFC
jgi:hypothetical protein